MSTNKRQKHWADRVHESIVSRNQAGQLNLKIKGGAEESNFPYFGNVKQDKVIYHSGKIQDGELLLEVNDESVVGLTLYDLNNLIQKAKDPVRFKTVKEGSILTKDLKDYLSKRFEKTSVDSKLQSTIRDNLYVRTLPCTTRKQRPGEIDGINYTFVSVEKFEEMQKNGDFLEHGNYDGNFYGTPKPAITPLITETEAVTTNLSNEEPPAETPSVTSSNTLASSDGKRRRRRSNTDSTSLLEDDCNKSSSPNSSLMVTTKSKGFIENTEEPVVNGLSPDTTNQSSSVVHPTEAAAAAEDPVSIDKSPVETEMSLGDFPEGWEMAVTDTGDHYFIDHINKKTSWKDPRLDPKIRKKLEDCEDDELPPGWEKVHDPTYGFYYVDHVEQKTQSENPVLQAKRKLLLKSSTENEEQLNQNDNNCEKAEDPLALTFTSDPNQLQGITHRVDVEKSSRGFGFTIIGGDEPKEFLQIKCIVPNGPAAITGNIFEGDVIVRVNETCVLGWTHPDVVKLFQSISVGDVVTLELNRGYPLLVDSTNVVNTYAIKCDDQPGEEFEKQLRMLNNRLEDPKGYYEDRAQVYDDVSAYDAQLRPDIYQYPPPMPARQLSRATSVNSLPSSPIVIQVIVEKGENGFGFTVADSPQGQRVKSVHTNHGCHDLMEGDILLEIDGSPVQNMPHNNVVDILKDYNIGESAIIVIQRNRTPAINFARPPPPSAAHYLGSYPSLHDGGHTRRSYQTLSPAASINQNYLHQQPDFLLTQQLPPNSVHYLPHTNLSTSCLSMPMRNLDLLPGPREQMIEREMLHPYQPHQPIFDNHYHPEMMSHVSSEGSAGDFLFLTVVLHREESGFGFRILGGNTDDVTIGAIVPGGAADREGTLKTGDRLLTVDDKRIARLGHNEVVSLMGSAARNNIVKLGIRRRVPPSMRIPTNQMMARHHSKTSSVPDIKQVILTRKKQEGFGFTILSTDKNLDALAARSDPNFIYAPHKIGRLNDNSPATLSNQLHVGDRVLAINGRSLAGLLHPQIATLIKESGHSIQLDVLPYRRMEIPIAHHQVSPSHSAIHNRGLFQVELKKSATGFGFGIRGGKEYNLPLYVLRIAEDGPAAQCGHIQVGDILMEINDVSVLDIAHSRAIALIKEGGLTVKLLLQKGDGSVPDLDVSRLDNSSVADRSCVSYNSGTSRVSDEGRNRRTRSIGDLLTP